MPHNARAHFNNALDVTDRIAIFLLKLVLLPAYFFLVLYLLLAAGVVSYADLFWLDDAIPIDDCPLVEYLAPICVFILLTRFLLRP